MQHLTYTQQLRQDAREAGLEAGRQEGEIQLARQLIFDLAEVNRVTLTKQSAALIQSSGDTAQLRTWLLWVAQQRDATLALPDPV